MRELFLHHFKKEFTNLEVSSAYFVLAVSGGLDSVVLTDLLANSGFDFCIAHCNFQLRGEESNRDEFFVKELAKKYNKEIFVKRFDTNAFAAQKGISIQEAARFLRYEWFEDLRSKHTGTTCKIVTAHQADDAVETVLFNFFRGTGIGGLHGIQANQGNIIRPLLFARRKEIELYATEKKLNWVEDTSNTSDKYSRNFIRHQIIPLAKQMFPEVEQNILNNISRLQEVEAIYLHSMEGIKKSLMEYKNNEIHIPVLKLQKQKQLTSIIHEIIREYDFTSGQVQEVIKLLDAATGSYIASSTHRIIKNRKWLIITEHANSNALHLLIEKDDFPISFEGGLLHVSFSDLQELSTNTMEAMVDADLISFPLMLRKVKTGDYFYPLGMRKKKKLSKFMIDLKLSKTDKERVWVLENAGKIIWVLGYRIDDRFKVSSTTKKVWKFSIT